MAKEVKFIERDGEKFVAKETSWVKKVKRVFWTLTLIFMIVIGAGPLYIKSKYSEPIKKSIVVSMFFDLQQGIAGQYAKLLNTVSGTVGKIKQKVDFDKPINAAVDKIKLAQTSGDAVKKSSDSIKRQLENVNNSMALAKRFGVKFDGVDKITKEVDNLANSATNEVNKVNGQLDGVKATLSKATKEETDKLFDSVDKMVDQEIRGQLSKVGGGSLSDMLLRQYNTKSIAPWRPSTWKISNRIYADLESSSASTVQIIMGTINTYFGYVAWGLVAAVWAGGLFLWWTFAFKKYKMLLAPFIVCPNCGHAFADKKKVALSLLKILQPWTWF